MALDDVGVDVKRQQQRAIDIAVLDQRAGQALIGTGEPQDHPERRRPQIDRPVLHEDRERRRVGLRDHRVDIRLVQVVARRKQRRQLAIGAVGRRAAQFGRQGRGKPQHLARGAALEQRSQNGRRGMRQGSEDGGDAIDFAAIGLCQARDDQGRAFLRNAKLGRAFCQQPRFSPQRGASKPRASALGEASQGIQIGQGTRGTGHV